MHVGIAYLRWWGKRSRHSRACAPAILRIWQEDHGINPLIKTKDESCHDFVDTVTTDIVVKAASGAASDGKVGIITPAWFQWGQLMLTLCKSFGDDEYSSFTFSSTATRFCVVNEYVSPALSKCHNWPALGRIQTDISNTTPINLSIMTFYRVSKETDRIGPTLDRHRFYKIS